MSETRNGREKVATFRSRVEAQLAAARLESEGIACEFRGDDVAGAYPQLALAGLRLWVREEDAARARDILARVEPTPEEVVGNLADAEEAVQTRGGASPASSASPLIYLMAVVVLGVIAALLL